MAKESTFQQIIHEINTLVDRRISSIFTCEFVIVEEVDHENGRVEISHKDDKEVLSDEVPILSAYAGDGFGTIEPIKPGDEGIVFFNMDPTTDILAKEGHVEIEKQRKHSVQDPMFMPRTWLDPHEVPDHEEGERLVYHESGTFFSIKPDGNTVIQHVNGNRMRLSPDEGVIETEDKKRQIGVRDSGVEAFVERSDGRVLTLEADSKGIRLTSPDDRLDYKPDALTTLSVDTDGNIFVDGLTEIGDSNANRVDTTQENTETDDPRRYAEVDEEVLPISRPSETTQTQYSNPSTVKATGAVDLGFYELRRHVPERREEDPDPTVTDPTDPAFVPLPNELRDMGELPRGYEWVNTQEGAKKIWGDSGSPVVIISGV